MTLILHLGAPKTATSTLQNTFFPRHPGLLFLGKEVDSKRAWTGWRTPEIGTLMLNLELKNLDFRPDRDRVSRMVDEIRAAAGKRPVVISSEDLCLFSALDSFGKLERIRDLFGTLGPIRLLLAVREQVSLLKSIYITEHRGEMLHLPRTKQSWYPSFDQYLDIHFRYGCGAVLESFRFAAMIERYESIFGRDNVFVYAFDEFRCDPIGTLRLLCRFIGVDEADPCLALTAETRENQHHSSRGYAMTKLRQRLTGGRSVSDLMPGPVKAAFRRWLRRGTPFDFAASPDAVRRIADYYRADNEALLSRRGIQLQLSAN